MSLMLDFSERASQCVQAAQRARSTRDRDFFIEMARAWCGKGEPAEDGPEEGIRRPETH